MHAAATVLLLLALALPGVARALALDPEAAATSAPAGEEPAAKPNGEKPAAKPKGSAEGEDGWLDVGHAFVENRIFAPVLRIDRFFSDERDLESERARSFIRLRQELRMSEQFGTPSYTITASANLKLPGINKQLRRLQVEIAGQTRDAFTTLFPGERSAGAGPADVVAGETTNFGTADAGLGYRLFESVASGLATHGDLGAGVMLQLPPGVYGRARLRFAEQLGKALLARQALTGFWRTDTLFGSTLSADLERPLPAITGDALARLSGSTTITQRSRGYEWTGDVSLLATLKARIGAQLGFGINGATGAPVDVDNYRVYLRLRRDVFRRWIFLELSPEYGWPWTPERSRHAVWAVAFRVEVQFQGNEAPPAPAPSPANAPAPPEPKDAPSAPRGERSLPSGPAPG